MNLNLPLAIPGERAVIRHAATGNDRAEYVGIIGADRPQDTGNVDKLYFELWRIIDGNKECIARWNSRDSRAYIHKQVGYDLDLPADGKYIDVALCMRGGVVVVYLSMKAGTGFPVCRFTVACDAPKIG